MSDIEWGPWINGHPQEAIDSARAIGISAHICLDHCGPLGSDEGRYRIPLADYKRITGMPEWSEAPELAIFLSQDEDGAWFWFASIPCVNRRKWTDGADDGPWLAKRGTVLGDWRDTLQERPKEYNLPTVKEIADGLKSMASAARAAGGSLDNHPESELDADEYSVGADTVDTSDVSMSDQYPAYYKDVSGVNEVDVYAVHQLFGIDDPSGCIHHANKKLLLSGVRTGGKSKRDDIREARDTLTRWLELNHE